MILIVDNSVPGRRTKFLPHVIRCLDEARQQYTTVKTAEDLRRTLKKYRSRVKGCILTGSPMLLTEEIMFEKIQTNIAALLQLECPVLGICFGLQVITMAYGGSLERLSSFQNGPRDIRFAGESMLINGTESGCMMEAYEDAVQVVPPTFTPIAFDARSGDVKGFERTCVPYRAGVLFHPEYVGANNEIDGRFIINNFLDICDEHHHSISLLREGL